MATATPAVATRNKIAREKRLAGYRDMPMQDLYAMIGRPRSSVLNLFRRYGFKQIDQATFNLESFLTELATRMAANEIIVVDPGSRDYRGLKVKADYELAELKIAEKRKQLIQVKSVQDILSGVVASLRSSLTLIAQRDASCGRILSAALEEFEMRSSAAYATSEDMPDGDPPADPSPREAQHDHNNGSGRRRKQVNR